MKVKLQNIEMECAENTKDKKKPKDPDHSCRTVGFNITNDSAFVGSDEPSVPSKGEVVIRMNETVGAKFVVGQKYLLTISN